MFWRQGWANAPELVNRCLRSRERHNSLWIKRPTWGSVLEEMGNPIVTDGCGALSPPDGRPNRLRDSLYPLSRGE